MSDNVVFVFGSNLAGRHGAGAAYYAMKHFGAVYGVGVGRTGNAYAIPTKDEHLEVMPWDEVNEHVETFIAYAKLRPRIMFILTGIGTGLAGFSEAEACNWIGKQLPENVYVSGKLWNHIAGLYYE